MEFYGQKRSASDDSYSESKKRRKVLSDYSKPVNFVSTEPNQKIDQSSNEDIDEERAGLGPGFGYASSKKADKDKNEDDEFLPTAFGKMIREGAKLREEKEKAKKSSMQASKKDSDPNSVGEFEKHTKGIGMRLLEKMGYKGGGLGKNEQGIVAPVEAKLRPKNMGMGFNDYKEATRPVMIRDENFVPRPSQSLEGRTKEKLWSKKVSKKKVYVTAEQLLVQKEALGVEVVQRVFDMRGPQVRILTNLENLNAKENARESDVPIPELQHNIELIVDIAAYNLHKLDNNLRNERDTVLALEKEQEKLQKEAHDQKQQLENMVVIINVLDQIGEQSSSCSLSLDSLAESFVDLQIRFGDEYTMCNLSCIACSYALPLFIRMFQGWNPLQNPTHGIEVVKLWKPLLQGEDTLNFSSTASLYMQLLMKVVVSAVRRSGANSWQARDPGPMLRLLESWKTLLPPCVLQNILDTVVMPRISAAVASWDPCEETIPIHCWIHPWLSLLGHKLENCYHTICDRLGSVLGAWHPSDMSAYYILSPWKTVFDPASWEQLMVRYIIPKLKTVMHEFQINPAHQKLDEFNRVLTWVTAIPTHHMLQLMDVFFDKWLEVLYHWLCSKPNFGEVAKWYYGWRDILPRELRPRLKPGLDMLSQAIEGMEVAPPLRMRKQGQFDAQQNEMQAEGVSDGSEMMSLKEVIGIYAQQNDLRFMPKPRRKLDERQIYEFGNTSIIFDSLDQKVFALTEDRWSLVSLEMLLDMQNRSKMKPH